MLWPVAHWTDDWLAVLDQFPAAPAAMPPRGDEPLGDDAAKVARVIVTPTGTLGPARLLHGESARRIISVKSESRIATSHSPIRSGP